MSAQANIAGLFPPIPSEIWNEHISWQPVPVHMSPLTEDYVLAVKKPCDRFNYLMIQYEKTKAYKELLERNQTLIRYVEEYSGMKLPTISDIFDLYDIISLEQDKGLLVH